MPANKLTAMTQRNSDEKFPKKISRPSFVYYSAMAGAATIGGRAQTAATPRRRVISANDKLNIAIIGYGGKGASDAGYCADENVVALCDVDENIGGADAGAVPKCEVLPGFPGNA